MTTLTLATWNVNSLKVRLEHVLSWLAERDDIDALVLQRAQAKKAKDFATADRIREELKQQGIEVTDVPGGAVWKRV